MLTHHESGYFISHDFLNDPVDNILIPVHLRRFRILSLKFILQDVVVVSIDIMAYIGLTRTSCTINTNCVFDAVIEYGQHVVMYRTDFVRTRHSER